MGVNGKKHTFTQEKLNKKFSDSQLFKKFILQVLYDMYDKITRKKSYVTDEILKFSCIIEKK